MRTRHVSPDWLRTRHGGPRTDICELVLRVHDGGLAGCNRPIGAGQPQDYLSLLKIVVAQRVGQTDPGSSWVPSREFLRRYSQSFTRWPFHFRDRHGHRTGEPDLHHPRGLTHRNPCGGAGEEPTQSTSGAEIGAGIDPDGAGCDRRSQRPRLCHSALAQWWTFVNQLSALSFSVAHAMVGASDRGWTVWSVSIVGCGSGAARIAALRMAGSARTPVRARSVGAEPPTSPPAFTCSPLCPGRCRARVAPRSGTGFR